MTATVILAAVIACAAVWLVADEARSIRATRAWIEHTLAEELQPLDDEAQNLIIDEENRHRD